jgi:hypothetical protein
LWLLRHHPQLAPEMAAAGLTEISFEAKASAGPPINVVNPAVEGNPARPRSRLGTKSWFANVDSFGSWIAQGHKMSYVVALDAKPAAR